MGRELRRKEAKRNGRRDLSGTDEGAGRSGRERNGGNG